MKQLFRSFSRTPSRPPLVQPYPPPLRVHHRIRNAMTSSAPLSPLSRRLIFGSLGLSGLYFFDTTFNAKTIQRNLRTLWAGVLITLDYKLFFNEQNDVSKIHQRTAERILAVCQRNGGLYVKFGQGIASMNHILPPEYSETLKSLFNDAPTIAFDDVVRIVREEYDGCHPDDIFDDFERAPIASASIAQVHRAKLKDGTPVAVKVQKHYIQKQLFWDMLAYRFLLKAFEIAFDLPLYWSADYTEQHLREEVDFVHEAKNAEKAYADFQSDPKLSEYVYVPKVYWNFTTRRILTTEWIDGVTLTQREKLIVQKFSETDVMSKLISAFSFQIFKSGFVHADPHPGNIIVRRHPTSGKNQICILDHGLYMQESTLFRLQYAQFWKSIFLMDTKTMEEITKMWGINDTNLFASATLQRPYNPTKAIHLPANQVLTRADVYRMQMMTKEKIKKFLGDTEKIPRELIFVGRTMNLVRANNKAFGSPVNRINMMVQWAVKGMDGNWRGTATGNIQNEKASWWVTRSRYLVFQFNLWLISVSFYTTKLFQKVKRWVTGREGEGFEDLLDQQIEASLKTKLGITVNMKTFDA